MQTYFDLTEKERAALTREDVERYIDVELMRVGVLRVEPLMLEPEPEEPEIPRHGFARVGDLAFNNVEDARSFLVLKPRKIGRYYIGGGYYNSVAYTDALDSTIVEVVELATKDGLEEVKVALDARGAVQAENRKRRDEHDKAMKAQNEALEGMWSDWYRCKREDGGHRKVVETFESYRKLADGDADMAARFLHKMFTRQAIEDAAEYCAVSIPSVVDAPERINEDARAEMSGAEF